MAADCLSCSSLRPLHLLQQPYDHGHVASLGSLHAALRLTPSLPPSSCLSVPPFFDQQAVRACTTHLSLHLSAPPLPALLLHATPLLSSLRLTTAAIQFFADPSLLMPRFSRLTHLHLRFLPIGFWSVSWPNLRSLHVDRHMYNPPEPPTGLVQTLPALHRLQVGEAEHGPRSTTPS